MTEKVARHLEDHNRRETARRERLFAGLLWTRLVIHDVKQGQVHPIASLTVFGAQVVPPAEEDLTKAKLLTENIKSVHKWIRNIDPTKPLECGHLWLEDSWHELLSGNPEPSVEALRKQGIVHACYDVRDDSDDWKSTDYVADFMSKQSGPDCLELLKSDRGIMDEIDDFRKDYSTREFVYCAVGDRAIVHHINVPRHEADPAPKRPRHT